MPYSGPRGGEIDPFTSEPRSWIRRSSWHGLRPFLFWRPWLRHGSQRQQRPTAIPTISSRTRVSSRPRRRGVPDGYRLAGDVVIAMGAIREDLASMCVALDAAADLDGDGTHAGSVAQMVPDIDTARGRWFRFSFRGLPQDHFAVADDQLFMKVEFFARGGASYLDCVTRKIYPMIQRDRQDIAVNGVGKKGGAAVWKLYTFDFKVPFPEVDQLNFIVGFRSGSAGSEKDARFFVDDLSLVRIPDQGDGPRAGAGAIVPEHARLIPLGGRWFYAQPAGESVVPKVFDRTSADRLRTGPGGSRPRLPRTRPPS